MRTSAPSRRLVVLGLGAALAGCGGSESPTLYTLVPRPGTPIARRLPPAVLRGVEIAQYLDRPQIVRYRTQYQLAAGDFERWGEGFDEMVTRVLLEDLSQRLPGCPLAAAGSAVAGNGDIRIGVALARFDPDPDGTVVLEARWTIDRRDDDSGDAVRLERIEHRSDGTTAGLVAAMSDSLGSLADHIAQALAG